MEIKEDWKTIEHYPDYMVSNLGRVKSFKNGKEKILKQGINKGGYLYVVLCKEGKMKTFNVHRLVCTAFLPNTDNLPQVNHKNEIKTDNRIENLEYCTAKYNSNYGTHNERVSITLKGRKLSQEHKNKCSSSLRIPIIQYDLDNKMIGMWESAKQASEVWGIDSSSILKCCRGKYKTCGGYKWKYLQDFLIELKKAS